MVSDMREEEEEEEAETLTSSRRQHRRIAFGWLNQRAVDTYTPLFDFEATEMIKALYEESKGGAVPINPQVRSISINKPARR
jgi:hypothetical protein